MIPETVTYSIIVPVYNSKKSLPELARRMKAVFRAMPGTTYELLFVDDGSPNAETWPTLNEIAAQDPNVRAVKLMRNFGQQAATICGLQLAVGDYIITMDDDLQHAPEDIPLLAQANHHDIVIGQFPQKKHGWSKRLASKIKGEFDRVILGKPKDIQLSAFRLFNRLTADAMLQLVDTPYPFIPAMMFYVTKDVVGVNITHHDRADGASGYNFFKLIKLFNNLLINNSSLLLRFIGNMGLSISFLSFVLALVFIYRKLFLKVETVGWTSLFVTVLFIGGAILFTLGIVGEYLVRIIKTVEKRPLYLIRKDTKQ